MSDCREIEPFVVPYVDGNAEPEARRAVEAHLHACAPCRDRLSGERTTRHLLGARKASLQTCAPESLKQRCAALGLPAARSTPTVSVPTRARRRTLIPLSLAATVMLAVGAAVFFGLNQSVEALAAQLALDHVKCFQFQQPGGGVVDAAGLGDEWSRTRGWVLRVPASSEDQQLELLGVRRCASTVGLTAHLMYKWRGAPLSVYVLNSAAAGEAGVEHLVQKLGHEAIIWSRNGRTYAVVARARPEDLEPIVKYVNVAAR